MKNRKPAWSLLGLGSSLCFVGIASALPQTQSLPEANAEQTAFFESKIRPVLAENCQSCHGKTSQNGELRLDTAAGILKGGSSGEKILTSDPSQSILVKAVHQTGSL